MNDPEPLLVAAQSLVTQLVRTSRRIVFAESCTAGLISATIARIPGVSEWLAGSAVVYQPATKTAWLDIPESTIEQSGVVSRAVAEAMAEGVLASTFHAEVAASVTGDLGPGAAPETDGIAWTVCIVRLDHAVNFRPRQLILDDRDSTAGPGMSLRERRQHRAAQLVMEFVTEVLSELPAADDAG